MPAARAARVPLGDEQRTPGRRADLRPAQRQRLGASRTPRRLRLHGEILKPGFHWLPEAHVACQSGNAECRVIPSACASRRRLWWTRHSGPPHAFGPMAVGALTVARSRAGSSRNVWERNGRHLRTESAARASRPRSGGMRHDVRGNSSCCAPRPCAQQTQREFNRNTARSPPGTASGTRSCASGARRG